MRAILLAALAAGCWTSLAHAEATSVLDHKMKSLDGKEIDLASYHGKVVLIVNVASRCGYTPQYAGLEKLHETYGEKGLVVLGVPCNQFGKQEPGTEAEIADFCRKTYDVKFPMLAKVDVNGDEACELFKELTSTSEPAGPVKWNFEKFLVGKDGKIVGRYRSGIKPESDDLTKAIEAELAK